MTRDPQIVHDPTGSRFEIPAESGVAQLTYVREGNTLDLTHTKVSSELEGRGYASALARAALDFARHEGLHVIPTCPFVQAYLRKHREYADLVEG